MRMGRARTTIVLAGVGLIGLAGVGRIVFHGARNEASAQPTAVHHKGAEHVFRPSEAQWGTLTVRHVETLRFRNQIATEGKIVVDDDLSTPVFSPYSGRVVKLLATPGETVHKDQPLFVLEASDSVQAQNDFMAALTAVNKAQAQVRLTETAERRLRNLYNDKAIALKDWQQAQADLITAQNDLRSAETTAAAARNRLRLIGKTDEEVDTFQRTGAIRPDSTVFAPIAGTVVQRKVGPGQYLTGGASDPVFVIGDLSKLWLIAYVRETDAPKVRAGQEVDFTVLPYPDRRFAARIDYVGASIDPATRRRIIRATLDNSEGRFSPEMFANVKVAIDTSEPSAAVPLNAIIYEGEEARVWVVKADRTVEVRKIKLGLSNGPMIQVLDGLQPDESVIERGSLFIDRVASGETQ
jgi:cobalt-zinc-cadmium efflux system membrane fusion protein